MLDPHLSQDLQDLYQRLGNEGALLSREQLARCYATFRTRFGPERLQGLDGEALLTAVHDHTNRDSLVYWLEFKDDDEFPARFGSIAGGNALKFGIYRRKETGAWMTGSSQKQREIASEEAVQITRSHREQLLRGADLLESLPPSADDAAYQRLQDELDRVAPDVSRIAWGHKYLSLLYPDKLDNYHVEGYQRFYLIKLLQTPPASEGRYLCAGRYVAIAEELGLPLNHLTALLNQRNGRPYQYWRIGTRLGERESIWDLMRDTGCVAIGWSQLGDLSDVAYNRESKEKIRAALHAEYANAPGVLGQKAQEVFNFVAVIAEDDLVLAADGKRILGIGRVASGYQHAPGQAAPHRRPVEWLRLNEWELPVTEGLRTTVRQVRKDVQNLIAIERQLLAAPAMPPVAPPVSRPQHLDGIPGRIQAILERKGQVILYGPPGTGKTYWAQRTARDLAALAAFGQPLAGLDAAQRAEVTGEDAHDGLVRVCTFHPAYGYEDFIEGYRPQESAAGQLVFALRAGLFLRLCANAAQQPARRFYLLIDEINRGDIPRIFGELLTLLERDKRGQAVRLPLSGVSFTVPDNVYVIGTMNTADRSIALLDTALRRRFGFVELLPDPAVLGDVVVDGSIPLGPWLAALNARILEHIGRDARNLQIGHAYLLENGRPVTDFARLVRILEEDLVPLLQEYCYEDYAALARILGRGLVDEAQQRIRHELFAPARRDELVLALLAPAPDIATSPQAVAQPDPEESDEDEAAEDAEAEDAEA
jgi:5-methylcytosine-specific restriction protein B